MITNIISCFLSAVLGFLIAYITQKAKNKALQEDVAAITIEKEKVIAEYSRFNHVYQKKVAAYVKYNDILDQFEFENQLTGENIRPLTTKLLNGIYNAQNQGDSMQVINEFGDAVGELIDNSMRSLNRITKETNELKLFATDSINQELSKLLPLLKRGHDLGSKIFNNLNLEQGDFNSDPLSKELSQIGQEVHKTKEKILNEMREDLHNSIPTKDETD